VVHESSHGYQQIFIAIPILLPGSDPHRDKMTPRSCLSGLAPPHFGRVFRFFLFPMLDRSSGRVLPRGIELLSPRYLHLHLSFKGPRSLRLASISILPCGLSPAPIPPPTPRFTPYGLTAKVLESITLLRRMSFPRPPTENWPAEPRQPRTGLHMPFELSALPVVLLRGRGKFPRPWPGMRRSLIFPVLEDGPEVLALEGLPLRARPMSSHHRRIPHNRNPPLPWLPPIYRRGRRCPCGCSTRV
jgi:hypothetical protein